MSNVVLHQFQFSHFNDKARWALAFKGVDYQRESYLPGPHMRPIRKLSGQRQTPVLAFDDKIISGSAAIIDFLETLYPEPRLYPKESDFRDQALELQRHYDSIVGPASRTVLFSRLLNTPDYLVSMFAKNAPWLKRTAYRATFPLAKGLIAKGNGADDPANVQKCFDTVNRALDELAEAVMPTGYLAGERFTVADLTAAALLAPIANPQHPDMRRPEPIPAAVVELLSGWRGHPAIAWVNRMYSEHRPQ